MKENFRAELKVNGMAVEINAFVEEFLARAVVGAVSSLRGVEDIKSCKCSRKNAILKSQSTAKIFHLLRFPMTLFPIP